MSGNGVPLSASSQPTNPPDRAEFSGHVLSAELAPVADALVAVGTMAPVKTGEDGAFDIVGIEPGTQTVQVQALGYSALARRVDFIAGGTVQLQLTLERLPSKDPYVEILHYRGYSICDVAEYIGQDHMDQCTQFGSANSFLISVNASWRYVVSELSWTQGTAGADSFRLLNSRNASCDSGDPCYGLVFGTHYARVEAEPGKTDVDKFYDPYADARGPAYPATDFKVHVLAQWIGLGREYLGPTCQYWAHTVTGSDYKPGCYGVGVSNGIPFDLYYSIFHWDGPQDRGPCCPSTAYSALPDR